MSHIPNSDRLFILLFKLPILSVVDGGAEVNIGGLLVVETAVEGVIVVVVVR